MRSYSNTRCRDCGHEEVRYANVRRCRACGGLVERPAEPDDRDAEIVRLRARVELANRIVHIARFWAAHDAGLLGAIKEWEAA